MEANISGEILHDVSPLYRKYKDGRVERLYITEKVPPSVDPDTRVRSKDVVITPEIPVSARIFLPSTAVPDKKLPLLIYFHGGGFAIESAFSKLYYTHLNALTAAANVIVVSVEYRLAPEHPLPAAYDDAWAALKWMDSGYNGEEWISEFADLNRVFIGGDSAGGNIAHYVSLRAGIENLDSINLIGTFVNCPYFGGEEALENEAQLPLHNKEDADNVWRHVWAGATGLDDPRINPSKDPNISKFKPKKLLVFTAEKDFMRPRSRFYEQTMRTSPWEGEIELVDIEGDFHVYSVLFPNSENTVAFFQKVSSFINN